MPARFVGWKSEAPSDVWVLMLMFPIRICLVATFCVLRSFLRATAQTSEGACGFSNLRLPPARQGYEPTPRRYAAPQSDEPLRRCPINGLRPQTIGPRLYAPSQVTYRPPVECARLVPPPLDGGHDGGGNQAEAGEVSAQRSIQTGRCCSMLRARRINRRDRTSQWRASILAGPRTRPTVDPNWT